MSLKTLNKLIQYDTNPLIIFSNQAKVLFLNEAGEYLLSFISPKEVYETIIKYASNQAEYKYIKEKFVFGDFVYEYALIGYDSFEEIGVRFYKNTHIAKKKINLQEVENINIYFLLDLAKTYVFIDKEVEFIDVFDPDLPEIRFNKNLLIKVLNKLYKLLQNNSTIKTELKIRIGEYIKIDNKKYKLLELNLYAKNIEYYEFEYDNLNIEFFDDKIQMLLPLDY